MPSRSGRWSRARSPAGLELKGTDVIVVPGQVGRSVNMQKSLTVLSLQLQTLRDGVITLFIDEKPPVIIDASQQAELARGILSQPLSLTLPQQDSGAGPWTIDPQTLAAIGQSITAAAWLTGNARAALRQQWMSAAMLIPGAVRS